MSNFLPALVARLQVKIREFFHPAKKQMVVQTLQLRLSTTWAMADMPWYPRVPQFTPEELQLLHWLRRELSDELGPAEIISDCDIVYFALQELQLAVSSPHREDKVLRLRFHLSDGEPNRG